MRDLTVYDSDMARMTNDPPRDQQFAQLMEHYRSERGWSKADLAKRSGLDPSTITRFEQGSRAPERDTVLQIAEAMALPVADRDRMLAAAGFRSELWDDPMLVELAQALGDVSVPPEVKNEIRALVRMATNYARMHMGERTFLNSLQDVTISQVPVAHK